MLKDGESPTLQNVVLDERNAITRRKGYRALNGTAIGGGITRVDSVYQLERSGGTRYCVAFSSTSGYYATDGCQTFTLFISTLTRNNDVNCDAHSDNLYCVNNQYNFLFDGTNDTQFVATPASLDFIRVHRNRCFAAGATGNLSRLFYSNLGACGTWTTATDFIDISPEDGDVITGIGEPIFDMLPIYKKFSTWALKGATPATWVLINISKNTGAKNHRTIANFNNVQLFDSVGPNGGSPGIYGFDGIVIREVSQKLRNEIDLLDTFRSNTGQRIIDSKIDYDAGTFDQFAMSSSRESGFMQSSHTTVTETIAADFSLGTLGVQTEDVSTLGSVDTAQITTIPVSGSITMAQKYVSAVSFANVGSETNVSTNWTTNNWARGTAPSISTIFAAYSWWNNSTVSCNRELRVKIKDLTQTTLLSRNIVITNGINTNTTIDTSTLAAKMIILDVRYNAFGADDGVDDTTATSVGFMRGDAIVIDYKDVAGTNCDLVWDIREPINSGSGEYTYNTLDAVYTSRIYDLGISTPVWGTFIVSVTSTASGPVTFETRTSSSSSGVFGSWTAVTLSDYPASDKKRFFQYRANFSVTTTTNAPGEVASVSLAAASTGTWVSNELFLSLNMTAWNLFQTAQTTTGGGTIGYSMRISTYSGGAQYANRVTVTPDTEMTASTGAYVIVSGTFTINAASETAKTNSITLNWDEGVQAISATGKVFDGRYHYGAQSEGGTRNDVMYVLDSNGAWTKWTGVRPAFLNVVNQNFVMADSSTTTGGFVFKLYDTDSDNDDPISAFWESKDFALSGIPKIKAIDRVYTVHSSDDSTVTMTLKSDGGLKSKAYSLNFSTASVFGIRQTVDASSTAIQGNTFRVRYGNNAASKPWEVLGFILDYRDLGLMR